MNNNKEYQYERIKEYILETIKQDGYPDQKIESEHTLTKQFGVSRMTVRQALQSLQQEGIIYTVPKKGAYVNKKDKFKELDGLKGFSEDAARLQGVTTSKILLCQKEKTKDQKLIDLGLVNTETEVWHIIRVRYVNGIAMAYEDGYYNANLIKDIPLAVLEGSLYAYLEDTLHLEIDYANQNIDACLDKTVSKNLSLTNGTPLLRILQTTYLKNSTCIEYGYTYYRVDTYSFNQVAYRKRKL